MKGMIMAVWCLTISHRTAPLVQRESLALTPEQQATLTATLAGNGGESAILATCNRLELYWLAPPGPDVATVHTVLANITGVNTLLIPQIARVASGEAAARHLCRVAAGLESQVLGEPEILGQVRQAQEAARAAGTLGPVLDRLFTLAITAGKRARAETAISRGPGSVAHAAVQLAAKRLGGLSGRRVFILGAGSTGRLVAHIVRSYHPAWLGIANRTRARAEAVASAVGAVVVPWEALLQPLIDADVLFVATGASTPVITAADLAPILAQRHDHPLVIIDLALPRNVEPAIALLPHVYLADLDALHSVCHEGLAARVAAIPQVEAFVEEAVAAFQEWERTRAVSAQIAALCAWAEQVRDAEVQKALRKLQHLSERDRDVVLGLSQGLVHKLLHRPIAALRAHSDDPTLSEAVKLLFALDQISLTS